MKKTMSAVLFVGLMAISGRVWAATSNQTAPVSISVNSVFALSLTGSNAGGLNFGARNPGDEVFDSIGLSVQANHGVSWTLTLQASPLLNSDGVTTLGGPSFQYNISGDASAGTYSPAGGVTANVPGTATTIFTAGSGFYDVSGQSFGLGIKVGIPSNQKSGSYSTTLNISLVDAI